MADVPDRLRKEQGDQWIQLLMGHSTQNFPSPHQPNDSEAERKLVFRTDKTWEDMHLRTSVANIGREMADGGHLDPLQATVDTIRRRINSPSTTSIRSDHGTGKEKILALLLPMLEDLLQNPEWQKTTAMIFMVPTQFSAYQLYKLLLEVLGKLQVDEIIPFAVTKLHWPDVEAQKKALEAMTPTIVVATPGRLRAMLTCGALKVNNAKAFVIDDADVFFQQNAHGAQWQSVFLHGKEGQIQRPIFSFLPKEMNFYIMSTRSEVCLDEDSIRLWTSQNTVTRVVERVERVMENGSSYDRLVYDIRWAAGW